MLQLKKFPDIPVSTQEEARGSRPHPEELRFRYHGHGFPLHAFVTASPHLCLSIQTAQILAFGTLFPPCPTPHYYDWTPPDCPTSPQSVEVVTTCPPLAWPAVSFPLLVSV